MTLSSEGTPETSRLVLPSNGTVADQHIGLELTFRKRKANALLTQLRELIAEKSFKYTDQIRKAPRKGVRTRGQTAVLEINRHLAFLCQVYAWNRARMIELGADESTLKAYQVLEKDDVKCSTAILTPNRAGSTKVTLSWIWQSADRRIQAGIATPPKPDDDDEVVAECEHIPNKRESLLIKSVRRVHWLRGRAAVERWREEVVLVRHEMKWDRGLLQAPEW